MDRLNRRGNASNDYLAPLKALRPFRSRYEASSQWRGSFFDSIGTDESFVGNDTQAVADFDRKAPPARPSNPARYGTMLRGYRPVDARRAILRLAATHHVIFINEAHHVPMDRAFTLSLLRGLYRQGFRYFAAEALDENDRGLQARGYPTQATGYYTREPVFGDLVRTALIIGFRVIPYEYRPARTAAPTTDPLAAEDRREAGEARNLYERTLRRDPHAKILVHAGYGHIVRQTMTADWPAGANGLKTTVHGVMVPMAVYFERLSGIVPLCIDQTNLMAHPDPRYENGLYRYALGHGQVRDRDVVMEDARGQSFVPPSVRGGYDVIVFHAPPKEENGRPRWLRMDGLRRPVPLPRHFSIPGDGSLLVQAFLQGEGPGRAVPADQFEVQPGASHVPPLMLPSGRFLVRIIDSEGTVVRHWYVTVEGRHQVRPAR